MLKGAVGSVQFTTVFLVQLLFILCHLLNALKFVISIFCHFIKLASLPNGSLHWHTVHVTTCDVNLAVTLSGPRCVVPTIY